MATKKYKRKQKKNGFSILGIIGAILLVAVICFGALLGWRLYNENTSSTDSTVSTKRENKNQEDVSSGSTKTAEPENEEEKKTTAGNDAKAKTDELEKQLAAEVEKNENGLKNANVVLNEPYEAEGKIIISSTITNIVETEGNCNYIFTNNSTTFTKKTRVLPNAKNTVCEAVMLEKGSLNAGQWKVRLEYKSNYAEGVSETQTFTIK